MYGTNTVDIKKHIQTHLNQRNPESFEDTIIILSMFNDILFEKETQYRDLSAQRPRSGSIGGTIQARTLVLAGASVRKYVVDRKIIALQMVGIFKCRTLHPIFQRHSHYRLDI